MVDVYTVLFIFIGILKFLHQTFDRGLAAAMANPPFPLIFESLRR